MLRLLTLFFFYLLFVSMSSAEISGKRQKPPDGQCDFHFGLPEGIEVLLGNAAIRDGFMDRCKWACEREAAAEF
jgi:hypothetical protein